MLKSACLPQDLGQIPLHATRVKSQQSQAGICRSDKGEDRYCAEEAEEYVPARLEKITLE